jgi:hypothetical protein
MRSCDAVMGTTIFPTTISFTHSSAKRKTTLFTSMVNTPITLYMAGQVTVTCHLSHVTFYYYFPQLALLLESRGTELEGIQIGSGKDPYKFNRGARTDTITISLMST